MALELYHGTTDALPIRNWILPPRRSGVLREDWRKKYLDDVFLTDSMKSARMYAKKAAERFGGNPIVYVCKPIGIVANPRNTEYLASKAKVVEIDHLERM